MQQSGGFSGQSAIEASLLEVRQKIRYYYSINTDAVLLLTAAVTSNAAQKHTHQLTLQDNQRMLHTINVS